MIELTQQRQKRGKHPSKDLLIKSYTIGKNHESIENKERKLGGHNQYQDGQVDGKDRKGNQSQEDQGEENQRE